MQANNAVTWFEIPAADLDRAATFYGEVIGRKLTRMTMGPQEMVVFPYERSSGVGGCVLKTDSVKPGQGSVVYLYVGKDTDIDAALSRAERAGGRIALQKTALPNGMGYYAHIIDSEGNRVGLHAL